MWNAGWVLSTRFGDSGVASGPPDKVDSQHARGERRGALDGVGHGGQTRARQFSCIWGASAWSRIQCSGKLWKLRKLWGSSSTCSIWGSACTLRFSTRPFWCTLKFSIRLFRFCSLSVWGSSCTRRIWCTLGFSIRPLWCCSVCILTIWGSLRFSSRPFRWCRLSSIKCSKCRALGGTNCSLTIWGGSCIPVIWGA